MDLNFIEQAYSDTNNTAFKSLANNNINYKTKATAYNYKALILNLSSSVKNKMFQVKFIKLLSTTIFTTTTMSTTFPKATIITIYQFINYFRLILFTERAIIAIIAAIIIVIGLFVISIALLLA